MIRKATFDDVDAIVALGAEEFARSPYSFRFRFDQYEAKVQLARCIADPRDCLVLVSESGGRVDGFVVAGTFQLPFATQRYVSDIALVSEGGSGLWLLRRMVKWARSHQLPVMVNCLTQGLMRGYISSGLTPVGQLFVG